MVGVQDLSSWPCWYWCATLETCKDGKLHFHLYLQFTSASHRKSKQFRFENLTPRADTHDLLGEGVSKRKVQESLDRGFFYVWADKVGTRRDESGALCVAGNYAPSWTKERYTYPVKGRWLDNLWKAHKLTHDAYERYVNLCREGVVFRKRNLDAVRETERNLAEQAELAERVKRVRGNPELFQPFPEVPQATEWLRYFRQDQLRYPVLVLVGKSRTGKTEWAQSLFQNPLVLKVGTLAQTHHTKDWPRIESLSVARGMLRGRSEERVHARSIVGRVMGARPRA